jgi:uncharacterized protein with von Willebrand factor type A (vWA) domain
LTLVDLSDRGEVRHALRTALKIRRRDREAFDELFGRFWGREAADAPRQERPLGRPMAGRAGGPLRWGQSQIGGLGEGEPEQGAAGGDGPGYSPEALLRRKPFDACTPEDLAAMGLLLHRLARKLAMDAHTRFLLAFVLSLTRVARRTEVFAFNTSLTRLTPWLLPGKIGPTLDRLAAGVPDWSGGTRIGESLAEFTRGYLEETVNGGTVVVILSDGLDRGDTALLVDAMRAIRARARKVIWLNPLLGDPRYEPTARGMQAALPFIDHFCPAHNLESLERLLPLLAA